MTKIYYDTEFNDTGRVIDLISIGMCNEIYRGEYYAVNADADWDGVATCKNAEWMVENVIRHLPLAGEPYFADGRYFFTIDRNDSCVKPKNVIAEEVREYILSVQNPKLWAYYSAHDHVVLSQLWGPLVNMPEGIPWRTNDLKQEIERLGNPEMPPEPILEHHALADALWNRRADERIQQAQIFGRIAYMAEYN